MRKTLLLSFTLLAAYASKAQLVVDNTTLTPKQLVEDVLVGTGVTVSNVMWNGSLTDANIVQEMGGTFSGTSTAGLTYGVVLGTGDVQAAVGPNISGSYTLGGSGMSGTDPDLQAIASSGINDQAVLEFDFVPQGDSIKFRYVFSSDEYPEFVCSSFNDVFGFFITGPNPFGPAYAGTNIALIPGSGGLPVTINSVNPGVVGSSGTAGGCTSLAYSMYYINNLGGITVQYDGLTTVLTAEAAVICGETYHIKLAIADVGDFSYDSGVFLEAGSFSSNAVDVTITTPTSSGFVNGAVYENCILGTSATFYLVRPDAGAADTIPFAFSGSAVLGADFTSSTPDTFAIFPAGQDSAFFGVTILNDGITEGLDSLIVSVYNINPCGDTIITSGTLYINDPLIIDPNIENDTIPCLGQPAGFTGTATGSPLDFVYSWTGPGGIGDTDTVVNYTPPGAGMVTFTATDQCGFTGTDTAYIVIVPVPVNASAGPDFSFPCPGNVIILNGSGSGGTGAYTYDWDGPGLSATTPSVNYSVAGAASLFFTVTDVCGQTDTDTVIVSIVPVPVFANAGSDVVITCPGDLVNLNGSSTGGTGSIEYLWSNSTTGTIATTPSTTYAPASSQLVFLTVTDDCGQVDTDTLTVTIPGLSNYNLTYTPNINVTCPGEVVTLTMTVNSGGYGAPYTYDWENGDSDNSTTTAVTASPTTFELTISDGCGVDTTVQYTLTISTFDPLAVSASNGEFCIAEDGTVALPVVISGGAGNNTVLWAPPVGSTVVHDYNTSTGVVMNPLSGNYYVVVTDQCGNLAADTSIIEVLPCNIEIPNIVTPNGDGVNDVIHVTNLEYHPGTVFMLFNRWGQVKYESSDYQNNYSPTELTDGVYFYVLKLTDGHTPAEYNGTIQVNKK